MPQSLPWRWRVALVLGGIGVGAGLAIPLLRLAESPVSSSATNPARAVQRSYAPRHARVEPGFGTAPIPGQRVHSTLSADETTIYDVHYTIGADGLRVTPGSARAGEAVVLFGGSFTFGEGVEDHETFAARMADVLPRTPVVNAGFHGYGPHHMLRALETGRIDGQVPGGVREVVHLALAGHEDRVGGRVDWALAAPRYRLGAEGVVSDGEFVSGFSLTVVRALRALGLQAVLNRWLAPSDEEREADFDLLAAIIARSRDVAKEKWGAGFTVLYWGMAEDIPGRLESAGVRVIRLREVFGEGWWEDLVIPGDGHPSAAGHRQIARAALAALDEPALPGQQPAAIPQYAPPTPGAGLGEMGRVDE